MNRETCKAQFKHEPFRWPYLFCPLSSHLGRTNCRKWMKQGGARSAQGSTYVIYSGSWISPVLVTLLHTVILCILTA